MTNIFQAEKALGNNPTLKEAYEAVIWGVPDVRTKLIAEQSAPAVTTRITTTARAATAAQRAAKSLPANGARTQPGTAPRRSLDEDLSAAFDQLAGP